MNLNDALIKQVLDITHAKDIVDFVEIQSLWSGYGKIIRVHLDGGSYESVIVKQVTFPNQVNHPKGWQSDLSHQRKVTSYQVEIEFYKEFSRACRQDCKVPEMLSFNKGNDGFLLIMEDLSQCFPVTLNEVNEQGVLACIKWLAWFHATFLNKKLVGLWPVGTYWHLDTRPQEFQAIPESRLKSSTLKIDQTLNRCRFKTLVHGDAKVANFCFQDDLAKVAAVDFQYAGGGAGIKDVVYFFGSCLNNYQLEKYAQQYLDYYFKELKKALSEHVINFDDLKEEWLRLYPFAWADFERFLQGWSPGHWKLNQYSKQQTENALNELDADV